MNMIEVDGKKYVDREELLALIKEHKQKAKEGKEPGFIEEDKDKRMAAYLALNHLGAALRTDEERKESIERLKKGRKMICHYDANGEVSFFSFWCKHVAEQNEDYKKVMRRLGINEGESVPVFTTNEKEAMIFEHADMADFQIEKITGMYGEAFGKRLHAIPPALMKDNGWRNLFRMLYSEPEEEAENEDQT